MKGFTAEFHAEIKSMKNQGGTEITLKVPTHQLAKYMFDLSCLAGTESVVRVVLEQQNKQIELPEADAEILERWPIVRFEARMGNIVREEEGNKLLTLIDTKFATIQNAAGLTSSVGRINDKLYVPIGDLNATQISRFIDQIRSVQPELAEMAEDLINDRDACVKAYESFVAKQERSLDDDGEGETVEVGEALETL